MTDRIHVAPVDDLEPGDRTIVDAEGRSIGVFNVDGDYYAVGNRCPHRGGPVCTGRVHGALKAEWPGPGERQVESYSERPAVACPWHGWEFDLETGTHLGDDTYGLPTFPVVVEDGDVFIEV